MRRALSVLCLVVLFSLPIAAQETTPQDSLILETESLLRDIMFAANSFFGLNGTLENDIRTTLDSASSGFEARSNGSTLRLYPFLNLNQISVDPNQNYLLARGSVMDFSQTHTLLPNYQVMSTYDSSGSYVFVDGFGRRRSTLRDGTLIPKSDYLASSFDMQSRNLLSKSIAASLSKNEEKKSGAVRIFSTSVTTNETFRKIFGGDQVAVDAAGNINLSVSGASEKTSSQSLSTGKQSQFTPKFEQKQQFNLRGTIGEKVEILFDQDSEREFDFENSVKLTYTGYDDEILQKLEAGNIDLSLPATEFVTASSQNKGLFGVKSVFRFANLNVTTIASLQRGEKTKLSYKPGSGQQSQPPKLAYDYAKDQFFFLSLGYRSSFENYSGDRQHVFDPDKQIINIKVFKGSPENISNPVAVQGIATFGTADSVDAIFRELSTDEYTYDYQLGILYLRTGASSNDILAVWYQTQDGNVLGDVAHAGTATDRYRLQLIRRSDPQPTHPTWDLEMKNVYDLGTGQLSPDDAKSIQIRFQSQTGDVKNQPTSVPDKNGQRRTIMEILHVDERGQSGATGPDNQMDDAFVDLNRGLIVFPRLRPFAPPASSLNGGFLPEVYPTDSIYRFPSFYDTDRSNITANRNRSIPQFFIEYTTSSRTSSISLGINVLEGSEEVVLGGAPLERNVGYTIDYFSGTVEILDPRFILGSGLEINYEQAQLFQIDKKSIFGARAEYNLSEHGLGQNSFIGTTALFQSQSTINKRVQLGEEPFRNFVWDVNTNLEFNARHLTQAANWLPFVATTQPSRINFRAEYAHLIPAPNTSNGLIRDSENGVAYVDDFEGVKRTFPLGASRKTWSLSSVPLSRSASDRGYMIWYQISELRQNISSIEVPSQDKVTTLGVAFQPAAPNPKASWGGMMRAFSDNSKNEIANTQFIEVWIQNQNNSKAKLHIDLGSISEDQNGNGRLNSELKSNFQGGISASQDRGLDELSDFQEDSTLTANGIPPGTTNLDANQQISLAQLKITYPWGVINYARSGPKDDPFGDNWVGSHAFQSSSLGVPKTMSDAIKANDILSLKPNGTDQNSADGEHRGDTEDLNLNGVPDALNSYFTYSLRIDTLSPDTSLLIGKGRNSWRLYRIPIQRVDTTIGTPTIRDIVAARVWVEPETNSTDVISFQLTEFQFVNSEWSLPRDQFPGGVIIPPNGKQVSSEELDKIVEISAVNTEENSLVYQKPRNVKTERLETQSGRGSQEVREQSLALILNELPPGASAIITKSLPQPVDFRNYGQLRMFVHGDTTPNSTFILPAANETTPSPITFFLRFGTDINNYFEIEQPLYRNWAETRNSIDIDLSDLSRKKFATTQKDADNRKIFATPDGKIIRIKGNPSLSNIRNLFMGVINTDPLRGYSGQVWTNELRVSDANDKPGDAAKAALSFNMGDLLSMSGLVQYRSAEFRTVEQRFDANGGNVTNWGLNGTLNLQKFYLERWGVSLPLVFNYSRSLSDPKYLPGNDILVKDARLQNDENLPFLTSTYQLAVDSVSQIIALGGDTTGSNRTLDSLQTLKTLAETFDERIQTININKSFSFSFSKQKRAENFWLTRYTLDNLTSNFSYTIAESRTPQYVFNRTTNWTSATSYTIAFQKKSLKPLGWVPLQSTPFIGSLFSNLGSTDFNYKLVSAANTEFSITSNQSELVERDATGNPIRRTIPASLTATRGYGMTLSPLQSLNSALSVRYQSDLRGLSPSQIVSGIAKGLNPFDGFDDFRYASAIDTIKGNRINDNDSLILNRDFSVANSFSLSYRPESFSFITHTLSYNSSHNLARQRPAQSSFNQSSQLSRRVQIDATYSLRNMIGLVGQSVKGQSTQTGDRRSRRDRFKSLNPGDTSTKQSNDTTEIGAESKLKFVTRKIGGALETALNTINDVRFNINFDNNFAMNGLPLRPTSKYSWFGYTGTANSGFVSHLFNFDLDTVQQFRRDLVDSSNGLFTYAVRKSLNYGFNYGFNFNVFTIDLRYDYSESRSFQTNRETRTLTRSSLFPWLKSSPIPMFYDATLRINNIGRWPLFNLMAGLTRNMNVSLTYNSKETLNYGQFTTTFTGITGDKVDSNIIRQSNGRQLQLESATKQETFPQIGYDIQWKGGVTQNITFSRVNQITISRSSIQTTNSISILSNISYTRRGGFRIPIWFLKKKQLNNEIRFASTFALTKRKSFSENQSAGVTVSKQKTDETTSWSVEPRVDYSFTSRLTGGLFFKYEYNKSLQSGKITRTLAGLNVNISIGS